MKKLIYLILLLLFASLGAKAQNTVTLESGTAPFTPQFRYKAVTPDSLNHWWMFNPLTSKYNRVYTATEANQRFALIGSGAVYTNGYGLNLSGFQFSVDTANITSKTYFNTRIGTATTALIATKGTVTSVGATGSNGVIVGGSSPITGSGTFTFQSDSSVVVNKTYFNGKIGTGVATALAGKQDGTAAAATFKRKDDTTAATGYVRNWQLTNQLALKANLAGGNTFTGTQNIWDGTTYGLTLGYNSNYGAVWAKDLGSKTANNAALKLYGDGSTTLQGGSGLYFDVNGVNKIIIDNTTGTQIGNKLNLYSVAAGATSDNVLMLSGNEVKYVPGSTYATSSDLLSKQNAIGWAVNSQTFSTANSGNFINSGGTVFTTTGASMSGGGSYSNYLALKKYTTLEDYQLTLSSFKSTVDGTGIAIGVNSGSGSEFSIAFVDLSSGANRGKLYITRNGSTYPYVSSTAISFTTGVDQLTVSVKRSKMRVDAYFTNLTTGQQVTTSYNVTDVSPYATYSPNRNGRPTIWTLGGTQTFDTSSSFSEITYEPYAPKLAIVSTSLGVGYPANDQYGRYTALNSMAKFPFVNLSSSSATTADVVNILPELVTLHPEYVYFQCFTNDAFNLSTATTQANVAIIMSTCLANGIKVLWGLEAPLANVTANNQINTLNTYIQTVPGITKIIDNNTPLGGPGVINSSYNYDGTHWNNLGHAIEAYSLITQTHDLFTYSEKQDWLSLPPLSLDYNFGTGSIFNSNGQLKYNTGSGYSKIIMDDASGNVSVGSLKADRYLQAGTPLNTVSWDNTAVSQIQLGSGGSLSSNNNGSLQSYWSNNLYYDGGFKYLTSNSASQIFFYNGGYSHTVYPSGTSGANVSGGTTVFGYDGSGNATFAGSVNTPTANTSTAAGILVQSSSGSGAIKYATPSQLLTIIGGAPSTTGTSLLYGNGAGGFSNATIGTGISFTGGSLAIDQTAPLTWTGAPTFSTVPVTISGNQSASSWTTNGLQLKVNAATLTNTSTAASGTVATLAASAIGRPTFASSNTGVTVTNGSTLYISNSPANGTNTTITNPFSLYVAAGNTNLGGTNLSIGSGNAQGATFRSIFDVIKLGSSSSIYSNNNGAQALYLSANSYNNTSGVDTYTASAAASLLQISSLGLKLYTAPTGTAGNPIAFTNVLGVDLSGNVTGTSFITSGGTVRLSGYTVATLPAGTVGDTAYVTDALAPTFGAAVVGGGAVVIPVFKNATTWVSY